MRLFVQVHNKQPEIETELLESAGSHEGWQRFPARSDQTEAREFTSLAWATALYPPQLDLEGFRG
jgi:hypothetical protein